MSGEALRALKKAEAEKEKTAGAQAAKSAPAEKAPMKSTVADRLKAELPGMKTAVMWAEILDRPVSRRGRR